MNETIKSLYQHELLDAETAILAALTEAFGDAKVAKVVLQQYKNNAIVSLLNESPKRSNHKWTDADRETLRTMYLSGAKPKEIAAAIGVTASRVSAMAHAMKITRKQQAAA